MRVFVSVATALLLGACGSTPGFDQENGSANGATERNGASTPTIDTLAGDGVPVPVCSNDLQTVVDRNTGTLIKKCPPDQGCSDGGCVAACDAAAHAKGSVGCDFVIPTPNFYEGYGACFAAFLANNWGRPTKILASFGSASIDVSQFARIPNGNDDPKTWPLIGANGLDPGQVAVVFLATGRGFPCPVSAARDTTVFRGSGRGSAFHLVTTLPVSAYDILPFGGAASVLPSAELLLPTSAWGKNYVMAMAPILAGRREANDVDQGPQWAQVVASENGTTIKIVPTATAPGGPNVAAAPANAVTTYTLNAGEFIQWAPGGGGMELSGSVIDADKPVGVFGGSGYLCLDSPTSNIGGGCDSAHQQVPPVSALGTTYSIVPPATRLASMQPEAIRYRFVGVVDGTKLAYDPPVPGAPTALMRGQVVDWIATGSFVVSSEAGQPFHVAQLMPGGFFRPKDGAIHSPRVGARPSTTMGSNSLGDEEYVHVFPPAQFLSRYVFFTDPTYATTNLVITRSKGVNGFRDVKVDCLGTVGGWKPVGTSGQYESTDVDLARLTPVGTCKNGFHVAESEAPFGLVVWGLDNFASYAYPAGGNVAPINQVVVAPAPR